MSFSSQLSKSGIRAAIDDPDCAARLPSSRAGLRSAGSRHEPPAFFAAVELAVLVVVTCLAMVAVIVTASDDASAAPARSAFSKTVPHPAVARMNGAR
jgi:hypothetical protein